MKELTIEEKAKRYDEAFEKARSIRFGNLQSGTANTVCEEIFPELKESEDEKIRKELIEAFKTLGDGKIPVVINYADIFAWLEKQGEQKPAWSEEDEEHYKACLQYFDEVNPDMVYYKDYQWLKSLKQRIGG